MRFGRGSRDEGFTLFEVMTVVLVLGILTSIAIATYALSTSKARAVTCQANQRTVSDAVAVYEQQEKSLPPDLAALAPFVKEKALRCPADGTPYQYNEITGEVTCPNHRAR